MAEKVLIPTAVEETWPRRPKLKVLYLGPWCRRWENEALWQSLGGETLPYHWDDRRKLQEDFLRLSRFREEALTALVRFLNRFHKTNYSNHFWRILIGPWLGYFVPILYDRWFTLTRAFQRHSIREVTIIEPPKNLAAENTRHFESQIHTDSWNERLFADLLSFQKRETSCTLHRIRIQRFLDQPPSPDWGRRLGRLTGRFLAAIAGSRRHFIYRSYLPWQKEAQLRIRLRQIPWPEFGLPLPRSDKKRQRSLCALDNYGKSPQTFASILAAFLPRYLPKIFLEGFAGAIRGLRHAGLPSNPQTMVTSNAWCADDMFKIWCGFQAERKVPLIIGQHGGNDGTSLFNIMEEHQFKVADRVVTWGWQGEGKASVKSQPAFNIKRLGQPWKPHAKGDALLVGVSLPRFFYQLYSMPIGAQWLDYFDGQCRFVRGLDWQIRKKLLVRLYQPDYGWRQKERWREKFPDLRIDEGHVKIDKLVRRSRLYISTYNATTFLESLHDNFPSLIFWNPRYFELRESARPFFHALESAGIFHRTPESAANHLNFHWERLEEWWSGDHVQEARRLFCHQYSRRCSRPLEVLKEILEEAARPALLPG